MRSLMIFFCIPTTTPFSLQSNGKQLGGFILPICKLQSTHVLNNLSPLTENSNRRFWSDLRRRGLLLLSTRDQAYTTVDKLARTCRTSLALQVRKYLYPRFKSHSRTRGQLQCHSTGLGSRSCQVLGCGTIYQESAENKSCITQVDPTVKVEQPRTFS